jgi:hypothetical protein
VRTDRRPSDTSERGQSLWLLTVSPTIWAGHFLASYITAAIWCAKAGRGADLDGVRMAVAAFTVVALAGILFMGWRGLKRHQLGTATVPHDFDTAEDRHRFIGFATVLLSAVSLVGVLYVAMPAVVFGACY